MIFFKLRHFIFEYNRHKSIFSIIMIGCPKKKLNFTTIGVEDIITILLLRFTSIKYIFMGSSKAFTW